MGRRWWTIGGFATLAIVLIRTAWVSDDSYITFRTADNLVHGYGPVWNTTERVQAFTHPLWLAVFTPVYAITREPYYTAMALCALLTIAAVFVLARAIAVGERAMLVVFAALLSSKAFVDFSTSGLENALTHFLLVVFLWLWWSEPPGERRTWRLSLVASLCMLNRTDLALLVGPPLLVEVWRRGVRASFRAAALGMVPFLAWECFSAFYYGSLVPNTAYAKLNLGFPASDLMARGEDYFLRTIFTDPVTLPVIVLAPFAIPRDRRRQDWPLVIGPILVAVYILRIGGDFMMGRFFAAPFVWSVGILAASPVMLARRAAPLAAAACVVLGLMAPWEPALLSGYGYSRINNLLHGVAGQEPLDGTRYISVNNVMDERRYYYESSGLLKGHRGQQRPDSALVNDGIELRRGSERVVTRDGIGFTGYFAGPAVHIVDTYALSDPLLARLPAQRGTRTGHYRRDIPGGYLESLASGRNELTDADLAAFYDRLHLVVSRPLWSVQRLKAVAGLLLGRYDHLLEKYSDRHPPS
jgi:arabinofuranosyltransferase